MLVSRLVPSMATFIVGEPLHWVPLADTVTEVTLDGKLTEPVVVPLLLSSRALPAEALVSVITPEPGTKLICSASRVATRGAVAKER